MFRFKTKRVVRRQLRTHYFVHVRACVCWALRVHARATVASVSPPTIKVWISIQTTWCTDNDELTCRWFGAEIRWADGNWINKWRRGSHVAPGTLVNGHVCVRELMSKCPWARHWSSEPHIGTCKQSENNPLRLEFIDLLCFPINWFWFGHYSQDLKCTVIWSLQYPEFLRCLKMSKMPSSKMPPLETLYPIYNGYK